MEIKGEPVNRAVPYLLLGNLAGAGFVKQVWPEPVPDFTGTALPVNPGLPGKWPLKWCPSVCVSVCFINRP